MSLDNLKEYSHAIVSFLNALRYDVKHRDQLADNVAVVASNISKFTEESLQKFEGKKLIKHSHSFIFKIFLVQGCQLCWKDRLDFRCHAVCLCGCIWEENNKRE